MQISRLLEIVYLLMEKKSISAGELARHFGVSVKTIYRDIDALGQADIPVYTTQGKGGGIALMDRFVLQKSLLSKSEQEEVLSALQGLQAVGAPQVEGVLGKLKALFGAEDSGWIQVDFSDWSQRKQNELAFIKEGILTRQALAFTYYGSSGEKTVRKVQPLQLWFKSKAWYLKAFCLKRQAIRLFKLTRMKDIRLAGERFDPPEEKDSPPLYATDPYKPVVHLTMWIAASQAYRVYDEFEEDEITKNGDGSFTVSVFYPEDEWVYGLLLSYGCSVMVLDPPEVRDILRQKLKKTLTLYEKQDAHMSSLP